MPLDFPSNPSDGQVYEGYYYDASVGVWQSNNGTQVPNIFKNVEYTTAQTYLTPVTVKGKSGQTANLQQWTNSAGNVLASIDEAGVMTVQGLVSIEPIVAVPTGAVLPYAGSVAPQYFLLCNGQSLLTADYPDLFAAIGYSYGGSGANFNLPNFKGRVPVGLDSTQIEFDALGETGGAKTHTLTEAQMPSHTHTQNPHTHTQDAHTHQLYGAQTGQTLPFTNTGNVWTHFISNYQYTQPANSSTVATNQNTTAVNQNTGGGQAHNNLQPYIVSNYIIKT
jgi:microcystin-dependent protein